MAHILFLTPQLPFPPHQGTSLRNYHILRGVATEHRLTLLSFSESDPAYVASQLRDLAQVVETVPQPQPRSVRERLAQTAQGGVPDLALRLANARFEMALQRRLNSDPPDIVQVEGLEMAGYIPIIRQYAPRSRVVFDAHNAETQLQRRAYESDRRRPSRWPAAAFSRVQMERLAAYEGWAMSAADAVVAVSDVDAAELSRLSGQAELSVTVIPNSIDIAEYQTTASTIDASQRFDLVFSGKMDYRPNVDGVLWFAESMWPTLKAVHPGLNWAIVGQRPDKRVSALGELPGVTVTGKVDRVQPYLAGAHVNIIPLRIGSGTRLKLIEAMASARAVVSTGIGAEGFPVIDGQDILLADAPEDFAAAVSQLLGDEVRRRTVGDAARQFAEGYDWRRITPRFNALYAALL